MKRDRYQNGTVCLDKRVNVWYFQWYQEGKRKTRIVGTLADYPTKAKARRAAKPFRDEINIDVRLPNLLRRSLTSLSTCASRVGPP